MRLQVVHRRYKRRNQGGTRGEGNSLFETHRDIPMARPRPKSAGLSGPEVEMF